MHEHYDADGTYTGHTVITRESAWDDETRARALRLTEYEAGICSCGCGQPIDISFDPKRPFKVDFAVCQAGRAMAMVIREEQRKAKAKNGGELPEGWDDGRRYYVTPVDKEA